MIFSRMARSKKILGFLLPRRGLRRRLLFLGLSLLGGALVLNTLGGSYYTRSVIYREASQLQSELAGRIAYEIEAYMEGKITRLADFAAAASFHGLASEEQRVLALLLLKNDGAFTELSMLDPRGKEVLKVSERRIYLPAELSDQSGSEKFKRAIAGETYISPVYTTDRAEPYATLAVPIKATPKEVMGVAAAEANLKTLWDIVGKMRFGKGGYAYVVDSKGNLIAHPDPSLVLKRLNLSSLPEVREFLQNPGAPDATLVEQHPGITGEKVISTYAPVKRLGWALVLEEPAALALAEVTQLQLYAILLLAAGLCAGALIIVWASDRITDPIKALHRGVLLIGSGNLDHRVRVDSGDEIEELADGVNRMAAELQNSYSTLEQKVEERTRALTALVNVTSTVNQSLELKPVLQEVIKKITDIFRFDATRIFLFNPLRTQLELHGSFETQPDFASDVRLLPRHEGIVGRVAESGEAMIFCDLQSDRRYRELSYTGAAGRKRLGFFAALPIKAREKIVGAIVFVAKEARTLTEDEMQLLASMANQIGVAVENARLYEDTTAKAKELSALYDVAATLNQSMDPSVVLREAVRKIIDARHFDAARVYLIDRETEKLVLKAYQGLSAELVAQTAAEELGRGVNGRVAEMGSPLVFKDIQSDAEYAALAEGKGVLEAGFRTYLSLPLKTKAQTIGVMNFLSYSVEDISSSDIALLASMANQIGVALENISLFEETARAAQRLSALFTVTAAVSQSLDLNSVLHDVIENITGIFRFDSMSIYLLSQQGEEFPVKGYFPCTPEHAPPTAVFRSGQGMVGQALQSGEPIVVEDVRGDPRYRELSVNRSAQKGGFSFLALFPLKAKLRVVGVVLCRSEMPRRLGPDEIRLLTSMINQIGVAVENANLFEEAKRKGLELEQLNRDLQEAINAKSEFMAAMSHELRTPLNVIIGNTDLMLSGFFGDMTESQKRSLQKTLHHSRTLLKLITDVLTFAKMEAQKIPLEISTFAVEEVLARVQDYAEHLSRNGHIDIAWRVEAGLPPLTTDALKLEEILQNLIGNAFKFTQQGTIEIAVRDVKESGRIEFVVADTGIGIRPEDQDRIFKQFEQVHEAHTGSYAGVGLGLSIVKRYLEMMHGDIRVKSEPGRGSTFTVTLPYASPPAAE
ncbi:MAG TPA: GAF domain-containing protein [Candidatus Acidoferrales bacterium]|nr:GAF domain-containing protein [Candidatus Acidoferrales bacterium]